MVDGDEARMERLRVRTFRVGDYQEVKALWKESGLEIRPGDSREEIRLKLKRDPHLFLVAETGSRIVASVIGAWDGRRGWIYHLGVLPSYQRKGIASKLVREVERRMKERGVVKVNASVYRWNRRSIAFFRKSGYEPNLETIQFGKFLRPELAARKGSS